MRYRELITDARKKKNDPKYPFHAGWDELNRIKHRAKMVGDDLADTYQLFIPKTNLAGMTRRERRLSNLANRYAYDERGNLRPRYKDWEEKGPISEAIPILPTGKPNIEAGGNKPGRAFWTSTAYKQNGSWTSEWNEWVKGNMSHWSSPIGYLYRVRPGALLLPFDNTYDAENIQHAFADLEVAKHPEFGGFGYTTDFPWNQIVKHFDGVHHYNSGRRFDDFTYGWDVESTAWFNTDFLQFAGEVKVNTSKD